MPVIKRRLVQLAMTLLAAFSVQSARAESPRSYASIFGGASFAEDADITVSPFALSGQMEFDTGGVAGVAAGLGWESGVAIEGEFTFIQNGLSQETLTGIGTIALDGQIRTYALMVNGYYRFETASPLTPYLGVGAGAALIDVAALAGGGGGWFRANDIQFAYQAIAGISLAVGQNTSLGFEYRYFGTTTPTFTDDPGGGNVTSQVEHQNQNLLVKVTHRFGVPGADRP